MIELEDKLNPVNEFKNSYIKKHNERMNKIYIKFRKFI